MSNICVFSRPFYPAIGGLERIAQLLATHAAGLGHNVEVVTDTPAVPDADDRRHPFKITRTREFQGRVRAFRRADAVLFMNVSLPGLLACLFARAAVVLSHHGIYRGQGFVGKFLELLKRQVTLFVPNISVSQFVASNLPGASVVIHNAYDDALFQRPTHPERERDFVFCGRLVSDKGADLCVRAFLRVLSRVPDATLTIVGDGPERLALEQMVESRRLSGAARFPGLLTGQALVAELQKHACMVVPSLWEEPFGIVALEGIACCDTVIVSRRGGLPEAVGDCGLVVEPTEAALSEAMISIVAARRSGRVLPGQPSDAARRAHLALHTPEVVTRRYLDVIERAIGR